MSSSDLGQQLSLLQSLNDVLNSYLVANTNMEGMFQSQSQVFSELHESFNQFENSTNELLKSLNDLYTELNKIDPDRSKIKVDESSTKKLEKEINKSASQLEKTTSDLNKASQKQDDIPKDLPTDEFEEFSKEYLKEHKKNIYTLDNLINEYKHLMESDNKLIKALKFFGNFLMGLKAVGSVVLNMLSSAISLFADFVKLTITLPFTLAERANEIGQAFRRKIIEEIGNSTEEFKKTVSFNSYAGRSVKNLAKEVSGSIKEFTILNSEYTKMFGYESETKVLEEANTILVGLGMFSEVFGKNLSTMTNMLYLKKAQSYLGIGVEELKYYALNAYVNVENINDQLHKTMMAISKVSKIFNIDSKAISSLYHKLRLNIEDFGHFSEFELAEMSAKLIKLRVKTEDVTSIFSKISTFEDAADTSAKLFQSFGAVIDAYHLLTAKDPAEMIEMLRDGMLQTGKQFSTLNRHEKQLMQQITGLSAETLNSVMNYNDLSLTQEEIRNQLNQENPIDIQIRSTKELTDGIKQLKKVLDFKSPFEAIFKGLMGNIAFQEKTKELTTNYSKLLEDINQTIVNFDKNTIDSFTLPLISLVSRFNKLIMDGTLFNTIQKGLKTLGDFIQSIFTLSTKNVIDDQILAYKYYIDSIKNQGQQLPISDLQSIVFELQKGKSDSEEKIFNELLKKGMINQEGQIIPEKFSHDTLFSSLISLANKDSDLAQKYLDNLKIAFKSKSGDIPQVQTLSQIMIKNLTGGLRELLSEGGALFSGFYQLGKTIVSSLIRAFFIASTSFLYLISGDVQKAISYTASNGLQIGKLLGLDKNDISEMSDKMAFQFGQFIRIVIPKAITIIADVIKSILISSYETLQEMILNFFGSSFNAIYPTLSSAQQIAVDLTLSEELKQRIAKTSAKESVELKTKNLKNEQLTEKLENIKNESDNLVGFDNKVKGSASGLGAGAIIGGIAAGAGALIIGFFSLPVVVTGAVIGGTVGLVSGLYAGSAADETENALSAAEAAAAQKMLEDQSKSATPAVNATAAVNDALIRIDDKDSIELIASKDTGLLKTSYDFIREKYNQIANEISIKTEKIKYDNFETYDEDKELISLINKFNNFIDDINNIDNKNNITIEKINFA